MRRALVAIAVLMLTPLAGPTAAGATPAAAARAPVTVATTTTPDGRTVELRVRDAADGLCLSFADASGQGPGGSLACEPVPTSAAQDAEAAEGALPLDEPSPMLYLFGVTTAKTATLDLRFAGGRRLRVPTVPGPAYTGAARGRVRFFLAARRGEARPYYARALDASGGIRAAADLVAPGRPPVRGPVTLERGRVAGGRFRLTTSVETFLAPRPGHPEHRDRSLCLGLQWRSSDSEDCGGIGHTPVEVAYSGSCANGRVALRGTVLPRVRRVAVRLRSGRELAVRTRRMPPWGAAHGRRAYLVFAPHAEAVRAVIGRGRRGHRIARVPLRLGGHPMPGHSECGGSVVPGGL